MPNEPHAFVALYEGQTIGQARIVAASSDPELVNFAATRMLQGQETRCTGNPVADAMNEGQRSALKIIQGGANAE